MSFIPPPTNGEYHGARSAVVFLGLWGIGTLVPGLIHAFAPDGGAETIAGLDLGDRREMIISVFAWMGGAQIVWALATLLVVWRCRKLVPFFLALVVLERAMVAIRAWITAPPASGHHPPEHYVTLIVLPLAIAFLILSLRSRPDIGRQDNAVSVS